MAQVKYLAVAGVSIATLALSSTALACNTKTAPKHDNDDKKVGICHVTGSKTNPYVFIYVSKNSEEAHEKHGDIVGVSSAKDCPKATTTKPSPTPTPSTTPTPTPTPGTGSVSESNSNGQVLSGATTPSSLPDTGAGLSTLVGVPALGVAARSYLRARRAK